MTVHTREADEDCWRILTAELPKDHRIHVHCFTDEPAFAAKLLDHFPNLYIGVTGVVTFTSNNNTRAVVADMVNKDPEKPLRILLETGALHFRRLLQRLAHALTLATATLQTRRT